MHEHGIADRLIREALIMAERQGLPRLGRITISLGALSGLSEESLAEPLRHALAEASLGGVEVVWQNVPPAASCKACGRDIGQAYTCPHCGSGRIEVTGGIEVSVTAVEAAGKS